MKLLDVEAVLNRETDIQKTDPEREVLKELNDEDTRYAILSHRWGAEVGYEEMTGLMKMEGRKRDEVRQRAGYQKIIESCKQAKKGGYEWLWIDTCCIDKRSSAELSEAINSMYRWYQNAQVCYAYLNDVDESTFPTEQDNNKFDKSNGWPEWFVRGWTLQELIAPKKVEFFNKAWVRIGNKRRLAPKLERITGISCSVLTDSFSGRGLSVARIMSWAAHRKTTRVEDRAYSLMGLFGVNMPMLYGEGKKAFRRLQLEIIREFSDQSIFAWNPRTPRRGSVLAEDPSDFRGCWYIERLEPNEFVDKLMSSIELEQTGSWYLRPNFRKIATNPVHCCRLAWLRWRARALSKQLCTFTVSNAGIQVCLPVVRLPDSSSHFRAILACSPLVAIDLLSSGSSFDRIPRINTTPRTYPEFKTLYLAHHQDVNEKCPNFILDDEHASYYGFTRCGAYPREFTGDAVTLSPLIDDLIVVVYANKDPKCYFAVGLGYHYGQEWVHVDYDRDSPNQEDSWTDFGRRAHARIWKARAIRAQDMEKHGNVRFSKYFVKHAHLPRSIWAARVVWGKWGGDDFKVMVDVVECPGCCDGPCRMTTTFDDCRGLAMPGLMETVSHSYSLELDGRPVEADECSGQRIALGDYGDYFNDKFIRTGNIYEEKRTPGIDLEHPTNCPVIPRVSSSVDVGIMDWMTNQGDLVVTHHFEHTRLALYQPQAFSLPANKDVSLLLKALSTRLSGKYLVTTIIQCSDFYTVDDNVSRRDLGDSAPDDGNHSTEARNLTPLCIVAFPQVWSREPLREQRKERFKNIRKHFYALLNTHQLAGTLPSLKSVNGKSYSDQVF
ncbi:heterokaryon incompatibility protein-domain-containing protein [Pisolithus sp. B1]|nr:heterokaryon incompatibility protein-domain-containing protein [Pisolithus sp. B1]